MAVIRYLVADVDAAVAFYVDVLGFELLEQWGPPFATVKRGDLTLWLSGPGSSAARPLGDGSRPCAGRMESPRRRNRRLGRADRDPQAVGRDLSQRRSYPAPAASRS